MSDMSDSETRATQRLYNKGMTKYNVDISGEDKDKVIEMLNRYDELIEENTELKKGLQFRVNYCKALERELYGEVAPKFKLTIEKELLEEEK